MEQDLLLSLKSTPFGVRADEQYMGQALKQAHKAAALQEVPVGAVLVDQRGVIIGRSYNQVERRSSQCAHAEMILLNRISQRRRDWRLDGMWLYVTLEPCTMCVGLIILSRLAGVVYGATSPLFGAGIDRGASLSLYRKDTLCVIAGVKAQESATLLKDFFKKARARR